MKFENATYVDTLWWRDVRIEVLFRSRHVLDTSVELMETGVWCRIIYIHANCDY